MCQVPGTRGGGPWYGHLLPCYGQPFHSKEQGCKVSWPVKPPSDCCHSIFVFPRWCQKQSWLTQSLTSDSSSQFRASQVSRCGLSVVHFTWMLQQPAHFICNHCMSQHSYSSQWCREPAEPDLAQASHLRFKKSKQIRSWHGVWVFIYSFHLDSPAANPQHLHPSPTPPTHRGGEGPHTMGGGAPPLPPVPGTYMDISL